MANYITDVGICLRVTDFSETSQIVGMFTRGHGLVPLIAKGAKRQSKKNVMSGPLDLLTSGEVVFVAAKEGTVSGGGQGSGGGAQLGTLTAWELGNHRAALRANLRALNAAMMCAELTTHLLQPLDPHPELYGELEAALAMFGEAPEERARVTVAYAKAALVGSGYWPQLGACMSCGRSMAEMSAGNIGEGSVRFSPRAGGVLCGAGGKGNNWSGGCHMESAVRGGRPEGRGARGGPTGAIGSTMAVSGRIILALDRLPLPTGLRANRPERSADEAALATAMQLLVAQVEAITDKPVRTRHLLRSVFRASVAGDAA